VVGVKYTLALLLIGVTLFVALLAVLELGRRLGIRRMAVDPEGARAGIGAVEGAVFGLLGLMIAFAFSGAASRFEDRRHLITQEANAIGTAWLRIAALPAEAQPALRDSFRRYVDARIETYRKVPDMAAVKLELDRSVVLQGEIWAAAVAGVQSAPSPATASLLPALNEMIDITTTRLVATESHPPPVIFVMLVILTLAGALLAGYGMAQGRTRNWLHMLGFALTMSLTVYVILDLEFPRIGLIRIDAADHLLVEVRESLK
jgi:hypothetical protein